MAIGIQSVRSTQVGANKDNVFIYFLANSLIAKLPNCQIAKFAN